MPSRDPWPGGREGFLGQVGWTSSGKNLNSQGKKERDDVQDVLLLSFPLVACQPTPGDFAAWRISALSLLPHHPENRSPLNSRVTSSSSSASSRPEASRGVPQDATLPLSMCIRTCASLHPASLPSLKAANTTERPSVLFASKPSSLSLSLCLFTFSPPLSRQRAQLPSARHFCIRGRSCFLLRGECLWG